MLYVINALKSWWKTSIHKKNTVYLLLSVAYSALVIKNWKEANEMMLMTLYTWTLQTL